MAAREAGGGARRIRPTAVAALVFAGAGLILAAAGGRRGAVGEADGALPAGVTAFDGQHPAVNNLDPDLLRALRRAARDAATAGVKIVVNSGWRSPDYQARLLRQAIRQYGSAEKAARWVATPATSPHVAGQAVDIGPSRAVAWLSRHGAAYGLCRVYDNEPWHYERRPTSGHGCPARYADARHDPRMQH